MYNHISTFVGRDTGIIMDNWGGVVYPRVLASIPVLFFLRFCMVRRTSIDLTVLLKFWNGVMFSLSCLGFFANLWHLVTVDFETSYTLVWDGISGCILPLFGLSRLLELIVDVMCYILHKKKLCLLQWSHQLTVMMYCWYYLHQSHPVGWWFVQTTLGITIFRSGIHAFSTTTTTTRPEIGLFLLVLQIAQLTWCLVVSVSYLLHPSTLYTSETLWYAMYTIPVDVYYLYWFCSFLETKYPFETRVNWVMCLYLGGVHVLGLFGVLRTDS
jgi:hypothetical protein